MAELVLLMQEAGLPKDLERILEGLSPEQANVERAVYSVITEVLAVYHQKKKQNGKINVLPHAHDEELFQMKLDEHTEKFGHKPTYIFVLDADPEGADKGYFRNGNYDVEGVTGKSLGETSIDKLEEISYGDGAVLIGADGLIKAVGVQLLNVDPATIPGCDKQNISYSLGFRTKQNGMRQKSSITSSYKMQDSIIYTLGEDGVLRRFSNGKITYSSHKEEADFIR